MSGKRFALATLVALALTEPASAALTSVRATDLSPARAAAPTAVSGRFELVGVHWRGTGRVEIRTRSIAGGWSGWHTVGAAREEGPELATPEASPRRGWVLGAPEWVGASDRLEVRARGLVTRVRTFTIRSPAVLVPLRRVAAAGIPPIVQRAAWGADESIRRGAPTYAPEVRFAVVHHTAGQNTYTRAEAPAVVRGIQLYHVQANGWNDIGYNYLVDRFGTVYEGRYGGIEANVVGAHAQGFNTHSTGVALLGTYGTTPVSAAAESSLERLLAWRLDLAHVDPASTLTVASGGNPRFAAGVPVLLRAISGHRDTGFTACPGDLLHADLDPLAAAAQSTGLPKLYGPTATVEGSQVTFRGRLSEPLPWTVTVTDARGAAVAGGSGTGTEVDWSWDATGAVGEYGWLMEAGSDTAPVTAASGLVTPVATPPPLELAEVRADADTVSPNADGVADMLSVSYQLTTPATVDVLVLDETGVEVFEIEPARWRRAGAHSAIVDPQGLPDGAYTVQLRARAVTGEEVTAELPLIVTRTLGSASLLPVLFSPNGDSRADAVRLAFSLTKPADVRVSITRAGRAVASVFAGRLFPGRRAVRWGGEKPGGVVRDGELTAVIEAFDGAAVSRIELAFAADSTPPRLRLVSTTPLRIAVSEAASLRLRVDGVVRRVRVDRPTTMTVPGTWRTVVADAWDLAGNAALRLSVKKAPPAGQ